MQLQFTGHHVEITPALREFTTKKFERLERFASMISNINVIFNTNKVNKIVEAKIKLHGTELHASSESEDMYAAIDTLIDKVNRQLIKQKEKNDERRS
jgi:putative sigma-54 modulation protein